MTQLNDAEQAHKAAHDKWGRASVAAATARARALELRQGLANGATDISATDLATADQASAHADLVAEGASQHLAELSQAVQAARAEEECDRIVSTLPGLGSAVNDALDALAPGLAALVQAVAAYDQFAEESVHRLRTSVHTVSERAKMGRYQTPTVDRMPVGSIRGAGQLAAAILPTMRALGVPASMLDNLKLLAEGAPSIPTA